jgi:hypothetical protein
MSDATRRFDGGPAFPSDRFGELGMSLRDWYIGQALNGFCANPGSWQQDTPHERATRAIHQADAVMRLLYGSSRTESQNKTNS